MIRLGTVLVAILLSTEMALAKARPPISDEDLAAITERGRALYEYDQAAWHGSDALTAANPPKELLGTFVCRKTDKGWIVAFGKLTEARDAFVIAYEAVEGADIEHFTLRSLSPPETDTGYFLGAARGIDLALRNFQREQRPYNVAVLAAGAGRFFVYVMPAQTKATVFPLGGDERFTISSDGLSIIGRRRMHQLIMDREFDPEMKPHSGVHTHFLSEVPEDSDVFCVLTRTPRVPEHVATIHKPRWVYIIQNDGSITWVPGNWIKDK